MYVCGIIVTFTAAWLSDRFQQRGILCIIGFIVSGIGFIIMLSVQDVSGKFFSLFLMVSGTNICNAGLLSWFGATYAPLYKRAFAVGFIVMLGNCGGLVSSFIYRMFLHIINYTRANTYISAESTAPKFIPGHSYCLALAVTGLIVASTLRSTIKRENERRDKVGDKDIFMGMSELDIALLGDKHPHFR